MIKTCRLLLLVAIAGLGCGEPALAGVDSEQISRRLEHLLAAIKAPLSERHLNIATLQQVYAGRAYRPFWVGPGQGSGRIQELLEILDRAENEGLEPNDYAIKEIKARIGQDTPDGLAELELLLSHELLHFASDLRTGRLATRNVDPEIFIQPGKIDRRKVLEDALGSNGLARFLGSLTPSNPFYRRLRRALSEYRTIAAEGGWTVLPAGPSLKPGTHDPRVAALRRRLGLSGDLKTVTKQPEFYDPALEMAVRLFQARHGLEADGAVGPKTLAALNVPVGTRIEQILINMERWRWMPDDLGDRYILVNLAGFEAEVVEDGRIVLEMRVVVGQRYRRTPVFSGRMTYLEFNPIWNIPPSIARSDIVPRVQKDPAYLAAQGIEVFSGWQSDARKLDPAAIDWSSMDRRNFRLKLRQLPGPNNALGRVKFMFPNEFNVYLHDSPSRGQFALAVRAFSSGCIRLERPLDLAEYLLREASGWQRAKIDTVVQSGKTSTVVLPTAIPVHLTYSTAWVGDGGTVHFRDDVYGRDELLRRALFS